MKDNPLILVRVETVAEEEGILSRLDKLARHFRSKVAPVLTQRNLIDRLGEVLLLHGIDHRIVNYTDCPLFGNETNLPAEESRGILSVEALGGVDVSVTRLAAALAAAVQPDELRADAHDESARSDLERYMLLIVNPETMTSRETCSYIERLTKKGYMVGIIYAMDLIDARFSILKSTLVSQLDCGPSGFSFITGLDKHPPGGCAPAALHFTDIDYIESGGERRETDGRDGSGLIFKRERGILIVTGHGNPLDFGAGNDLILCTRENHDVKGNGLFPCFHDVGCVRQVIFGREPSESTGLIGIQSTRAKIVIVAGCNLATLGHSWFDTKSSLVYQWSQGPSPALVTASGVLTYTLELNFLFLALAAEGLPLGRIVHAVNRVGQHVFRYASPMAGTAGPYMLFGNPCARVTNLHIQEVTGYDDAGDSISIAPGKLEVDPRLGALIRIPMRRPKPPFMILKTDSTRLWCRGIYREARGGESESSLYLWLNHDMSVEKDIHIELQETNPHERIAAFVDEHATEIPFWTTMLESERRQMKNMDKKSTMTSKVLNSLPAEYLRLHGIRSAMHPRRGLLRVENPHFERLKAVTFETVRQLNISLLKSAIEIARIIGSLYFIAWSKYYIRGDPIGPLGSCPCGKGDLYGQRFVSPFNGKRERIIYQCANCGPVGESGGKHRLDLTSLTRKVPRGGSLIFDCECTAPRGEIVQFSVAGQLKCWLGERRICSKVETRLLQDGESIPLRLTAKVPGDLTPGVYAASLLGVVNGSMNVIRQMIEVVDGGRNIKK